jgi:adenine/guanine phosphoribosyltransferase-like PRPP-binding protein
MEREVLPHGYLTGYHVNRSEMLETTLLSMIFNIKKHIDAQTIDLRDEGKPVYTVTGDRLTVHLPIRTTESGLRLAFFDLLSAAALDANADERLAEKLSAKLPKDAEVLVVPEGKSVTMARIFAKLTGLKLVVLRKKKRAVNPVADSEAYGSATTEGRQAIHLTADNLHLVDGRVTVIFDDVISTGGTAFACETIALRHGAKSVVHLLVFTEGDEWKQLIPPERVIALAALPIPVP